MCVYMADESVACCDCIIMSNVLSFIKFVCFGHLVQTIRHRCRLCFCMQPVHTLIPQCHINDCLLTDRSNEVSVQYIMSVSLLAAVLDLYLILSTQCVLTLSSDMTCDVLMGRYTLLTHSLSHTLTHSHTLTQSLSHTHSLAHSLTHTHSVTHSLPTELVSQCSDSVGWVTGRASSL